MIKRVYLENTDEEYKYKIYNSEDGNYLGEAEILNEDFHKGILYNVKFRITVNPSTFYGYYVKKDKEVDEFVNFLKNKGINLETFVAFLGEKHYDLEDYESLRGYCYVYKDNETYPYFKAVVARYYVEFLTPNVHTDYGYNMLVEYEDLYNDFLINEESFFNHLEKFANVIYAVDRCKVEFTEEDRKRYTDEAIDTILDSFIDYYYECLEDVAYATLKARYEEVEKLQRYYDEEYNNIKESENIAQGGVQ